MPSALIAAARGRPAAPSVDDWLTGGASVPVLSYWGRAPSALLRPRRIGTELSHDVLNPAPSMWTLGQDQPVIPGVPFVRRATARPRGAAGSLGPAFAPARAAALAVSPACALALSAAGCRPARAELCAPPLHFGRRPPQSNYPPGAVPLPGHGQRLGGQGVGGGIPRAAPPGLAPRAHGLPPILYATPRHPAPSCSEGSRGLSVPPRGAGIFTGSTVSPGPWSRQRPGRCAFRAGRNLPDKEFRYLRTVIVTAAVYRGLASPLRVSADGSA